MTLQNTNVTAMGTTKSSVKDVSNHIGEIEAGLVCHVKSDDTLSLLKADGVAMGVSLGRDLSEAGFTSICRKGLKVPLLLTSAFSPVIGAVVAISDTTGKGITYSGTGDSYVNATYVTGAKTGGIGEDGVTTKRFAYIDFPGGL